MEPVTRDNHWGAVPFVVIQCSWLPGHLISGMVMHYKGTGPVWTFPVNIEIQQPEMPPMIEFAPRKFSKAGGSYSPSWLGTFVRSNAFQVR